MSHCELQDQVSSCKNIGTARNKMGLKNQALHVMLANPHLSPFDVIDRPASRHDWMLVDHLITRFRVNANDYVEHDRVGSIWNMARTLAEHYSQEKWTTECLIMVRDGPGAQKPAVRHIRDRYQLAPHLHFCRCNADAIDYLTLKLLCDANVLKAAYIVTGREWSQSETDDESDCGRPVFRVQYDIEGMGTSTKPPGFRGVHVSTFATDSDEGHLVLLEAACKMSSSTEADTLMVELANDLPGAAMICTSDSDVIAVLAARGREGLTLRLTNTSYARGRPMHRAAFGDLLMDRVAGESPNDVSLESSELRLQALYDVMCGDDNFRGEVETRHAEWEHLAQLAFGQSAHESGVRQLAEYLYRGGIRGSVYGEFLNRVSALPTGRRKEVARIILDRARTERRAAAPKCVFHETFELFPDCSRDGAAASASVEGNNAKRSCDGVDTKHSETGPSWKQLCASMHKLSKLYAEGKVPRYSNGRYLRLTAMSSHLYMRIKPEVVESEPLKHKLLVFMILFGTDYTRTFQGLGPKGLLKAGVRDLFGSWCEELKAAWQNNDPKTSLKTYHGLYNKLAKMSKIPEKTRASCDAQLSSLTFRTMRYVYDLWRLTHPKPDDSYGFHVDENNIMTFVETM